MMKIIIALFENCECTSTLSYIYGTLSGWLAMSKTRKCPKAFKSIVSQTLCMSFFNSPTGTLNLLEETINTESVLKEIFAQIPKCIKRYEYRRFIFGLVNLACQNPIETSKHLKSQVSEIGYGIYWLVDKVATLRQEELSKN